MQTQAMPAWPALSMHGAPGVLQESLQSSPCHSDELLHLELKFCKYFCALGSKVQNIGECN